MVFLSAGVIATACAGGLRGTQQSVFLLIILAIALCALLLLEFVALVVEVRETEVQFSFEPFYRRRIITANIQHWIIRTYRFSTDYSLRYSWRPPKHCVELAMNNDAPSPKNGTGLVIAVSKTSPSLSELYWGYCNSSLAGLLALVNISKM